MRHRKRPWTLALVLLYAVLSLFPVQRARAAETGDDTQEVMEAQRAADALCRARMEQGYLPVQETEDEETAELQGEVSGTCGANLTWRLLNGTLAISGTGAMTDWSSSDSDKAPWYDSRSSIISVIIGNGVTSIGANAFYYCSALTGVDIPNSVTSIGRSAFYNCSKLAGVDIPNSVTTIGSNAFSDCSSLTSITIPGSVTSIESDTFWWCEGLTDVTISNGVTSIGNCAFDGCRSLGKVTIPSSVTSIEWGAFALCEKLTEISVNRNSANYVSIDGVLLSKDKTEIVAYPGGKSGEYRIPDGVTTINKWAFYWCSSLTGVFMPVSVTTIGSYAFAHSVKLASVTIPAGIAKIDYDAFSDCSALADVWYGGTEVQWKSISIGSNNENLTSAVIHYNSGYEDANVIASGTCGVSLTWKLRDETLSGGVGGTLTISGTGAMTDWSYQDHAPWYENQSSITSVVIEKGVTSIGKYAFYKCGTIASVDIPGTVTDIGGHAFYYCSGLTSVVIPNSVTKIGTSAFERCTGLTSVTIPKSAASVEGAAFEDCTSLTKVTLSNGVTSLGSCAFAGCKMLTTVTIPASVTSISWGVFARCEKMQNILVDSGNTAFVSVDGVVFSKDGKLIVAYPGSRTGAYRIPDGVTSLEEWAFYHCEGLTGITIPVSVTSIAYAEFSGCTGLKDVWYSGTETQWEKISIAGGNDPLSAATMHYNSTGPGSQEKDLPAFDIIRDAWSFGNSAKDFGYSSRGPGKDYPIPYSSFSLIFGDNMTAKVQYRKNTLTQWGGNCAGMSGTAALLYAGTSITTADFGKDSVSVTGLSAKYGSISAKTFIEAMQIAQYTETFAKAMTQNRREKSQLDKGEKNLDALFQTVAEASKQGQATVIAVIQSGTGGHALLAYGAEAVSDTEGRLSIYDCNYPGQARTLTLQKNSAGHYNGWSYDMGGYGVWGTGKSSGTCSISYIPYETIAAVWKNRGKPSTAHEVLTVNAENLTILSIQNGEVAQLVDGQLVTDRTDIYEVPELSMYWPEERSYYLPKDLYTISTTDDITLSASMADQGLCASVSTTASTVSFGVDDATKENSVIVEDASQQDTYSVSLESSAGGTETNTMTVSGTGKGETISISDNQGKFTFANCNIESISINGEEQIVRTITSASAANGKLSVTFSASSAGLTAAAFFDTNGRFLAMSSAAASGVSVQIPLPDGLPAVYNVRVMLLQTDTLRPLCAPYPTRIG